jgi:hypothetical protein
MSDETAEIIPRPPSSPIGSTLLIVCTLGLILAIGVVWSELFSEYLPGAPPPGVTLSAEMAKHVPLRDAENHTRDHYKVDYPDDDVLASVERDLGVGSKVGDLTAGSGDASSGDTGGTGEATPPVENPDGGAGQ